jgi:hypothetical protein
MHKDKLLSFRTMLLIENTCVKNEELMESFA